MSGRCRSSKIDITPGNVFFTEGDYLPLPRLLLDSPFLVVCSVVSFPYILEKLVKNDMHGSSW